MGILTLQIVPAGAVEVLHGDRVPLAPSGAEWTAAAAVFVDEVVVLVSRLWAGRQHLLPPQIPLSVCVPQVARPDCVAHEF